MTDWINDAALLLTAVALLFLTKQLVALHAPVLRLARAKARGRR